MKDITAEEMKGYPAFIDGLTHTSILLELETMDDLGFIARVPSHFPDKGQVMVRNYGPYPIGGRRVSGCRSGFQGKRFGAAVSEIARYGL